MIIVIIIDSIDSEKENTSRRHNTQEQKSLRKINQFTSTSSKYHAVKS